MTISLIAGTVVSLGDVVVNCMGRLSALKVQPHVTPAVTAITGQLHRARTILDQLSALNSPDLGHSTRHQQLATQVGNAFDGFGPIMLAIEQQLQRDGTTEAANNSQRELTTLSVLLDRQLDALDLLLQAIECQTWTQQSELMGEKKSQSALRSAQDCSSSLAGVGDIAIFISENAEDLQARFSSDEAHRGTSLEQEPGEPRDSQEFPAISPTVTLTQGNEAGGNPFDETSVATEDARRYSSSSDDFRYSSDTIRVGAPIGGRLPPKLNLYYPAGRLFLATRISAPLYSVQVNYRQIIPVDAEITVGSGPGNDSPPLATLRLTGTSVRVWAANQPSPDLSQVAVSINAPGGRFGIGYGTLAFSVPVPALGDGGGSSRLVQFEWKHSIVPEILNAYSAWKLKRKTSPPSSGEPEASGSRRSMEDETVATLSLKKDSRSKILTIRFEGSGATGEFGELWAVVTVLTALTIYQHKPSTR
ncbi:hypothetical protein GGR51DRAFT_314901 [Nemania sp. FL0031]|nr:hypothetical protein GGR51DRAFT_314901 [Nemania sp. FL0031]